MISSKLKTILVLLILTTNVVFASQKLELHSPNKKIKVEINISDKIYYSISHNNETLLSDNYLQMKLSDRVLGEDPRLSGQKRTTINRNITPVIPYKFAEVNDYCNVLTLSFKNNYAVEFRVYDNSVAYRFTTDIKGNIEIQNEDFQLNFPDNYLLHTQQPGSFKTAYEEEYKQVKASDWKADGRMSTLPLLIQTNSNYRVLVSESDLSDYPAMFIKGTGNNSVTSAFPLCPLEFGEDGDRSQKIIKEANYIAKTTGKRSFPWRYFVIAEQDADLIKNTMTLQLAAPSEIKETSWIKPGQVSWEWWNDASPYGSDVDFVSGYNLETYKYYIDFASKFGIQYIIMDEGWAKTTEDPFTPNPKVDVHELIKYGKEKNVNIILWLTWLTVEKNFNVFEVFEKWGVAGVKIDFMDRSDQWMVNYYERVAKEAAKHNILVDFHGSFKPAGLEYKYPNVLSYEGVRGMEQMTSDGATPNNSVYFPFIRNAVGPMDYTPGAMISMQPDVYKSQRPNSASIGTRAYQMALFVIFESGLQMLADNPTQYYKNQECTEFITQVPVTWDETRVLEAKLGEYVIVAKRKGDEWFIGGMTNSKEGERLFDVDLSFLDSGKTYTMTSFEDGINARRQAMDYRKKTYSVKQNEKLTIKMARSGGWAARLISK